MTYNPSLREEPRGQRAAVIPVRQESSILDWLENTGRLLAREPIDAGYPSAEEEITEFISEDDNSFDLDDDDDLDLED
jgi:hypothetical protein